MGETSLRPAQQDDLDILWAFLAIAAHEPDAAAARAIPIVAAHLEDWRRPGDFGWLAMRDGAAVGAVWARQFALAERPACYVDERTPEVSIAVVDRMRGQSLGGALLRALIEEAKARGVGLCLNVRDGNPALRLYERMGFARIPGAEIRNRTGGLSIAMALR